MTYVYLFLITVIAAIAKATADSIFSRPDTFLFTGKFWNEGYTIPYTKYKVNALHTANSIMFVGLISPIWIAYGFIPFIISVITFVATFKTFYNRVLVKKTA